MDHEFEVKLLMLLYRFEDDIFNSLKGMTNLFLKLENVLPTHKIVVDKVLRIRQC